MKEVTRASSSDTTAIRRVGEYRASCCADKGIVMGYLGWTVGDCFVRLSSPGEIPAIGWQSNDGIRAGNTRIRGCLFSLQTDFAVL